MLCRIAVIALLVGTFIVPSPIINSDTVYAASTKKKKTETSPSDAERKKMMELARELCRKKYGATSSVYRIDYKRKMVTCMPPGY